jgi:hypothetical protein
MNTPAVTARLVRHAGRRATVAAFRQPAFVSRPLSTTTSQLIRQSPRRKDSSDPYHKVSTDATGTSAGPHEGSASRTDREIVIEYPDDEAELAPHERPLRGRGGVHFVRTLPTFSLEGRTAVVTGGARGLGLVMGQALVSSGSDLAIVDLNSKSDTAVCPNIPCNGVWIRHTQSCLPRTTTTMFTPFGSL